MLSRMATLAQSRWMSLARDVHSRVRADDLGTHAAALAYQLFLSTLALSLVGLALIGLIKDVLPFDLPADTEEQFANLTDGSATLGIASFVALLWTASTLSRRASRVLSVIFRTGPEGAVRTGVRALATTLGLILLIGALPLITGILTAVRLRTGVGVPFRILGFLTTTALEFGVFLLAYTVLTPGRTRWRVHVPGATAMTIGWGLFKVTGGVLLASYVSKATLLYGTIGVVVGLLLVLRLATALFVYSAELSAIVAERRAATPYKPQIDREFIAPRHQFAGTVDRIDQDEFVARRAGHAARGRFLGDDRHARQQPPHALHDDRFGRLVGRRHRRLIRLGAGVQRARARGEYRGRGPRNDGRHLVDESGVGGNSHVVVP